MYGDQLFEESREDRRAREAAREYLLRQKTAWMCDKCGSQGSDLAEGDAGHTLCPACAQGNGDGNGGAATPPAPSLLARQLADAAEDLDRCISLLLGIRKKGA